MYPYEFLLSQVFEQMAVYILIRFYKIPKIYKILNLNVC